MVVKAPTRDRIVQVAHDLFYREGFHAVGLDRILSDVGVTKTTFYNHFESKDDLVLETLNWHDNWWREEFVQLLRRHGGDSPRGQLLALPEALREVFASSGYHGCIFINVAVQFPNMNDPAHRAAAEHKRAMMDVIRQIAGYAGVQDTVAFSEEMCLLLEGAYVTGQVTGTEGVPEVMGRLVESLVGRYLPG